MFFLLELLSEDGQRSLKYVGSSYFCVLLYLIVVQLLDYLQRHDYNFWNCLDLKIMCCFK
jgi:hypothetical protein